MGTKILAKLLLGVIALAILGAVTFIYKIIVFSAGGEDSLSIQKKTKIQEVLIGITICVCIILFIWVLANNFDSCWSLPQTDNLNS